MTDEKNPEMETQEGSEPQLLTEEQHKRIQDMIRHQTMMLMDEMKKIFAPNVRLTFIARNIDDPADAPINFSFLTEEPDTNDIINFLKMIPKPETVVRVEGSNVKS